MDGLKVTTYKISKMFWLTHKSEFTDALSHHC